MNKTIPIKAFASQSGDIDKVRTVSGNADLTEESVYFFPSFMICKSGENRNATEITADAQKSVITDWIGKPIYLEDHKMESKNKIGRIYNSWIEERNGCVESWGSAYSMRTPERESLFADCDGRIQQEMSCGYDCRRSICSVCEADIDLASQPAFYGVCPNGHTAGQEGCYFKDVDIAPDHVSFVGRPAVEGAGLVAAEAVDAATLKTFMTTGQGEVPADVSEALHELRRDAEDGKEFRSWAEAEFKRWFTTNNRDMTDDEITSMTEGLSAKHMMRLARIEKERFHEVMPDGSQQTVVETQGQEDTTDYQNEQDILRGRSKLSIWK